MTYNLNYINISQEKNIAKKIYFTERSKENCFKIRSRYFKRATRLIRSYYEIVKSILQ